MRQALKRRTAVAAALALTIGFVGLSHAYEKKDEGILNAEVILGSSQPMSGTLAYMGKAVDEGMRTYFEMVNTSGGVNGRKIKHSYSRCKGTIKWRYDFISGSHRIT